MRWFDLVFTVSISAGVASVCVLGSVESAPAAPAAPAVPRPADHLFSVVDQIRPTLSELSPDAKAGRGLIRVAAADSAKVVGFSVVTAFPVEQDQTQWGRWVDLTGTQLGDRLDLRRWTRRKSPAGEHLLCICAWVDRDGRRESRIGWCRFDPGSIAVEGATLALPARESTEIHVLDASRRPVPGALIVLDEPHGLGTGLVSAYAYTDETGVARFSGLAAGRKWFARLVEGAGPATALVETTFETPCAKPLEVVLSRLTGDWTYVRHEADFPFPGAAMRLTGLDIAGPGAASMWPVSRWVAPGRGPHAPFLLMFRATDDATRWSGTLKLESGKEFAIDDARKPHRLDLGKDAVSPVEEGR